MTTEEKKDLAQDALRYLTDLLPPERYGEDGRCEIIERALQLLATPSYDEDSIHTFLKWYRGSNIDVRGLSNTEVLERYRKVKNWK